MRNLERIPGGQCVVVANHASYLDGLVFTAALPPRFGFVIKREMESVPLAGALLRRLGSEFVERFNRHRGGADARRVLRTAVSGNSLVFFPEGTFDERPGLGEVSRGSVHDCRSRRLPCGASGRARDAARVSAEERVAASGADRDRVSGADYRDGGND